FGYLMVAERLLTKRHQFAEAWNFGPSEEECLTVETVVSHITRLWGDGASWIADDASHPKEAHFLRLDSSKAHRRLGWKPRLRLETALQWTVDWYKNCARGESATQLTLNQISSYMGTVAR